MCIYMLNQNDKLMLNYILDRIVKEIEVDEVPVCAILADALGNIIAEDINKSFVMNNRLEHAECLVLKKIGPLVAQNDVTLYITMEPCLMCYGAALLYNVRRIVYLLECKNFGAFSCHHIIPSKTLCVNASKEVNQEKLNNYRLYIKKFFSDKRY